MRAWVPADPSAPAVRHRLRPRLTGPSARDRRPREAPPQEPATPGPPLSATTRAWGRRGRAVEAVAAPPESLDAVRRAAAETLARAPLGAEPSVLEAVRGALAVPGPEDGTAVTSSGMGGAHVGGRRAEAITEELTGFGPLAPWVRRDGVTDVLVDADGHVWTDGTEGLVRRPLTLRTGEAEMLAVRLVTQAGRRLDPAVPLADARLDGVRVHAALPPVSGGGAVLSLRVPAPAPPSLDALARGWPDGARWGAALAELVAGHATVLVSGATGSGKTTLLSAALSAAAPDERIVLVEDTREAAPAHPHVIPLQTRAPNADGAGEVTLAELIRQALRMRPDRLVVGECRGAEVADLLTALNTGHQGAWGTLHANAADDVPARLTAMGALAGWSPAAVAAQARAGVDAVLHVVRDGQGRHPAVLAVPDRPADPAAPLRVTPALTWTPGDGTREGPGLVLLRARLAGRAATSSPEADG